MSLARYFHSGAAVAFTDAEFTEDDTRPLGAKIIEKSDARDPDRLGKKLADYAAELPTNVVRQRLEGNPRDWLEALEAIDNLQLELERPVMITARPERIVRRDLGDAWRAVVASNHRPIQQFKAD